MDNKTYAKKHIVVPNIPFSRLLKEIGRNSYVDWIFIIVMSLVVLIVLGIGSTYLYFAVTRGHIQYDSKISEEINDNTFDKKSLSLLMNEFDKKDIASEQAKKGFTGVSDPSI